MDPAGIKQMSKQFLFFGALCWKSCGFFHMFLSVFTFFSPENTIFGRFFELLKNISGPLHRVVSLLGFNPPVPRGWTGSTPLSPSLNTCSWSKNHTVHNPHPNVFPVLFDVQMGGQGVANGAAWWSLRPAWSSSGRPGCWWTAAAAPWPGKGGISKWAAWQVGSWFSPPPPNPPLW